MDINTMFTEDSDFFDEYSTEEVDTDENTMA